MYQANVQGILRITPIRPITCSTLSRQFNGVLPAAHSHTVYSSAMTFPGVYSLR